MWRVFKSSETPKRHKAPEKNMQPNPIQYITSWVTRRGRTADPSTGVSLKKKKKMGGVTKINVSEFN